MRGSFFINLKGFEFSQNNEELSGVLSQETQSLSGRDPFHFKKDGVVGKN